MTNRERLAVAGALLVGAATAFAAGIMVGGPGPADEPSPARPQGADARTVFSPEVVNDPWFIERQRTNVEALEQHCRRTGELCGEARQLRRGIDETR